MAVPRVFVDGGAIAGGHIEVGDEASHHLAVVLRRKQGDHFYAIDGNSGMEYLVEITEVTERGVSGRVLQQAEAHEAPAREVTLYQGLPKGKRFPLIVQKCTELGVVRIVPMTTARCVVRIDEQRAARKLQRWQKIAQEAARQCMGSSPPEISQLLGFGEALADWEASDRPGLFLDEALAGDEEHGLAAALAKLRSRQKLGIFVGPEGGFSEEEAQMAVEGGLIAVSLGSRILRTETAAVVACAIVMYEGGELGGRR
jgi:16S rRNA (uracil1498-N3)-methyltransferase